MKTFCMIIVLAFFSAGLIAQTATATAAGDGTEGNPYEISSLDNLYLIAASDDVVPTPDQATRWSSHYIQTADIDASATANWFVGEGWSSIGNSSIPFTGSYNGQKWLLVSIDKCFKQLYFEHISVLASKYTTNTPQNRALEPINEVSYYY